MSGTPCRDPLPGVNMPVDNLATHTHTHTRHSTPQDRTTQDTLYTTAPDNTGPRKRAAHENIRQAGYVFVVVCLSVC